MKTWAGIIVGCLVILLAGLRFLFFGPLEADYQENVTILAEHREKFQDISGLGKWTDLPQIQRKVEQENVGKRQDLAQIGEKYTLVKPTVQVPEEVQKDPNSLNRFLNDAILQRLKRIEELETSCARLDPIVVKDEKKPEITILKSWGLGRFLKDEENGNRVFDAAQRINEKAKREESPVRTYPGGERRINPQAGTIDLLIKPNWNGSFDKQSRILFYAQGSYETEGANPVVNYILLEKTSNGQIHFSLKNPESTPPQLDRSTPVFQWSPETGYQRVTVTWDKDPQKTQLYVNGSMAFDLRGSPTGMGNYGTMPGTMVPSGMTARGRGTGLQTPAVPLPHSIDEIYVGARPDGTESADATIDNLRILNYAVETPDPNTPIQYETETTLLIDYFQTPYVDGIDLPGNYITDVLDELRDCIRMETSTAADKKLVELYRRKKETIKRSIGLGSRSFAGRSQKDRFLIELLSADQMIRILTQRNPSTRYDLDEILRLLQVNDHEPSPYDKNSLIGFLDLVIRFVELGIESNLASIKNVRIQGEAFVVADEKNRQKFEEEFQKMGETLGIQTLPRGVGSGTGYPGGGYPGGGYPGGGYPGGGYPGGGYPGGGYPGGGYPGGGYPGGGYPGGGYPGGGYPGGGYPGGGYPGGGYPGGGYPGGGYPGGGFPGGGYPGGGFPGVGYPGVGVEASKELQEMAALRIKYFEWRDAFDKGTIPPDFYEELAKKEISSTDVFYTRRVFGAQITGKIDYVPEFLYKLEYGDPLRTDNNLVSFSQLALAANESDDLLDCAVTVNVHYVSNEAIMAAEKGKPEEAQKPPTGEAATTP